ncbi:hypothetical protein CJJ17_18065 [Gordonia polyisoprenivorans]|nr:hypothetical protein CJJ17_18065 [Gordonia polyisoprenivorans]
MNESTFFSEKVAQHICCIGHSRIRFDADTDNVRVIEAMLTEPLVDIHRLAYVALAVGKLQQIIASGARFPRFKHRLDLFRRGRYHLFPEPVVLSPRADGLSPCGEFCIRR